MPPTSPLRNAILSHLRAAPMHGYRLRRLTGENAWLYSLKRVSIYSALKGLAKQGLVEYRSELHAGRARKIYSLTEAGRRELDAWLALPPEGDVETPDLYAFKISLLDSATAIESAKWLQEALDELRERIRLREGELEAQPEASAFARLAMEHGVEQLRSRARMLERALDAAEEARAELNLEGRSGS